MQIIPLQALPNQSFSLQLGTINFDISIKTCSNIMAFDIAANNTPLVTGMRAVNGAPILPYAYLERNNGNFIFISASDAFEDYPIWQRFGVDQILVYASPSEINGLSFAAYVYEVLRGTTD